MRPGAWHSPAFEPEGYQRGGVFVAMEWPKVPTTILRVHTDNGLIGLGEAHRGISAGAVAEAAYVHVCAATRACTLTSDIVGEQLRVDDLITRPLVFHDGLVDVPQEPGLGVALDMAAIERYGIKPA